MAYSDPDYMLHYRLDNREKLLAYSKAYEKANREKRNAQRKARYEANREREIKRVAAYQTQRRKTDPSFKLAGTLRNRVGMAVKKNFKAGSAVRDLGCSIPEFKAYIEKQFTKGMSWDNHGEWHLDHIKPLALFDLTNRDQFLVACHYTNYQPLWGPDNLSKGAKYD